MSCTRFADYADEYGVSAADLRAAVRQPRLDAQTLGLLAVDLAGDERHVLALVQGDPAVPVAANPAGAATAAGHLAGLGTFACGCLLRFARDVDTYDTEVATINAEVRRRTSRLVQLAELRSGAADPDALGSDVHAQYIARYRRARTLLDDDAAEVARMLTGARTADVRQLVLSGFIPMSAAHLYPALVLTEAEKRRAYRADVREGTIPDFATLPTGTVQDWLEEHPDVRADLDLFAVPAPHGGDSADAAAWFGGLGALQQLAVSVLHADAVGNRDGVPAWARDLANRERIDDLRVELAALPPTDEVRDKLAALDQVERTLGLGGRQLLLLDAWSGIRMHAAVAVGNVDTADHVAVFTPGFTSTVRDSLRGYDADMAGLARAAERRLLDRGGSDEVAAVTWLGYDAPQWSEVLSPTGSVASPDRARAGGDALATFLTGINDSRAVDPHLTALGHSYGSTTTGFALQHDDTGVDDAIIFGSPGLGTSERDEIEVPAGHLFRIEARNDPVADLAQFGQDPTWMSDTGGLSAKEAIIDGQQYDESTGHSAYLDDGTTSQYNIAVTVAGIPEKQVDDDGRGAGDLFTWWPDLVPESWR